MSLLCEISILESVITSLVCVNACDGAPRAAGLSFATREFTHDPDDEAPIALPVDVCLVGASCDLPGDGQLVYAVDDHVGAQGYLVG